MVMVTPNTGILVRSKDVNGENIDYYSNPIEKRGKTIEVLDPDMPNSYDMGDWCLNPISRGYIYNGNIPQGNYFEVYCETGTIATLEVWFTNNGDIFMYNPEVHSVEDLRPVKKGRYVREGDVIRYETTDIKTAETTRSYACVINGKYCPEAYISEEKYNQIKGDLNKPISISNPLVAPAAISEKEFFENYPCLICNTRQMWTDKEWKYYAGGEISVYAKCKLCGYVAQETEKADTIKRIAYNGSNPIPGYRSPAGSVRYLDNPCPYCHTYQARYIKWKDKMASVHFWGILSSKIGARYICDNCKKTWE